jgi:hypothetical protein
MWFRQRRALTGVASSALAYLAPEFERRWQLEAAIT